MTIYLFVYLQDESSEIENTENSGLEESAEAEEVEKDAVSMDDYQPVATESAPIFSVSSNY